MSADISERICWARVQASRAGRQAAACWGYDLGKINAAWRGWSSDGLNARSILAALDSDDHRPGEALWRQAFEQACAPVKVCRCCGRVYTWQTWHDREQALGSRRTIDPVSGYTLSTITCETAECQNGLQRVLLPGGEER